MANGDSVDRGRGRERDLVLAPNEFAFISDETKGNVDVYTGPHKTSLANTDQPVIFSERTKRFERRNLEDAIQTMATAPEGWYIVMKNPETSSNQHPPPGSRKPMPELVVGRKVNIPGPVSFALWPGQMAKVIKGHHLRSNQYLIARVYDEEAARKNLAQAVIKRQQAEDDQGAKKDAKAADDHVTLVKADEIVLGKLIVIKGTDVSFYIPPTGIEVVGEKADDGNIRYIRDAVTLERLEYCLLLDQSGTKRYEQGPQVVFPRATENFVEKNVGSGDKKIMTRKFRSIELNETSGIYVKVIAPYTENNQSYKVGDEMFITGKDQMIYFPREEHAIVKYGTQEIHYGIAIPAGEARYVMDRNTGDIRLQKGPCVFLPDPRKEVIVRRIMDLKMCDLMFPGNKEALEYNAKLLNVDIPADGEFEANLSGEEAVAAMATRGYLTSDSYQQKVVNVRTAARGFGGDAFDRKNKHTKPRTILLDTKYEGAVTMDIWNGYAVKLVKKTGESRVVVGPATVLLDYDELPQVLSLSRGKPKMDGNVFKTVYLRVAANKVSDVVQVETKDLCRLNVTLSYRVSFEGADSKRWFDVDNYVKFLTDHLRSKLRNAVKKYSIEEFYANSADLIRDITLGKAEEGKQRVGMSFTENNMRIYDVEILDVGMEDRDVEKMLISTQRDVINQTLIMQQQRRHLAHKTEIERISQQMIALEMATKDAENQARLAELQRKLAVDIAATEVKNKVVEMQQEFDLASQEISNKIQEQALSRERSIKELALTLNGKAQVQQLEKLQAEVDAVVNKTKAITPELIAALQAFGDKELLAKLAQSFSVLSIAGGDTIAEVLQKTFGGTKIAEAAGALMTNAAAAHAGRQLSK